MSSIDLSLKNHSAKLLAKMSEMKDSGILTDVSLKVGEQIFKAHRVVLAASSDYFSAMFAAGMKESFDESIELKDSSITPDSLKIILDAVYKTELMVTEENVFEVLEAADHLQMTSIIEQCSKYLSKEIVSAQLKNLDLQSLQKVLNIAEKQSFVELQEDVFTRMAASFKELSEAMEFPELISIGQLLNLLQRNNLTAPSETFVFRSVVKWIYHNKEERLSHAAKLFRAVRLGLVEVNVLITELRREELKGDEECFKLLHESSLYHHMPSLLPELPLIKTEPRALSNVLIAIQRKQPLKYYDVTKKAWQEYGQNIPIADGCSSVVSFGNFVYVGSSKKKVYRYSIDNNCWDEFPPMPRVRYDKRYKYQLFVLGEYLYAFGDEIAERYSFVEKTWQVCANVGNSEWTWAVLDGRIYAVGSSQTFMVDESKNKWMPKSNNLRNRVSCYAFGCKGKLVIAGGSVRTTRYCGPTTQTINDITSTVEAYCKKSNRWSEVTQNHPLPSPFSGVVVDNTVFIKLNNFVFDTGIKVSPDVFYSPNLSIWKNAIALTEYGDTLITYTPLNTNKLL